MVRLGGQVPLDAAPASVRPGTRQTHQHSSAIAAEPIQQRSHAVQRSSGTFDRQRKADPAQRSGGPDHKVLDPQLKRSAKFDGLYTGVALRKQREVGDVAGGRPAHTKSLETYSHQFLPSPGVTPGAVAQPLEWLSRIAKHGGDRCLPARST